MKRAGRKMSRRRAHSCRRALFVCDVQKYTVNGNENAMIENHGVDEKE